MEYLKSLLKSLPLKTKVFNPGDIVLKEGDCNQTYFLVLKGCLEFINEENSIQLALHTISEGSLLGLYSFLHDKGEVLMTVVAREPSELLVVDKITDQQLTVEHPRYREHLLKCFLEESKARIRNIKTIQMESYHKTEKLILQEKMTVLGQLSGALAHELNNHITILQKGVSFIAEAYSDENLQKMSPIEKRVRQYGWEHGSVASFKSIREKLQSLQKAFPDTDRRRLQMAVEIQNDNPGVELKVIILMSETEVQHLYKIHQLSCKLHGMARSAEMVTHLVSQFKAMGKPPSPLKSNMLLPILREALDMQGERMENVCVHMENNYTDVLFCRVHDLIQVFANIFDNAIEAMQGKGNLWIVTRRDMNRVVIEVKDDGPGIPDSLQDKIFDPHMTTKNEGKTSGMGLGLTICRQIIMNHGGTIQAVPSDAGAMLKITLPIHNEGDIRI